MTETFKESIESIAADIRNQARHLRVDTFLSFIYTADVINRYLDFELTKQPASRTGFNILHNLILHGGSMKPTEISNRVFRSKHTVTRVIDTLEKQGLVKRGPIGEDRRTRKVNITKKGLELIKRTSAEGRQRVSHAVFLPLDQKQIKELRIILRQVRKHVLTLITHSKNGQGYQK
jgi:DNA-binding MarR family transcriptional regulator